MFTMRPVRSLRISGTTSRHMRTAPKRLVSKVSRHIEVGVSTTFASVASG